MCKFIGLRVAGGSGWFILERNFAMYSTFADDEIAVTMRKILEHTLMPEEVFFQTLITNSPFCERVVLNNIRFINWYHEIGCNCERHTVDSCGCSPMVVLHDREKVKLEKDKLIKYTQFFGRKFNSYVDMEALELVEERSLAVPEASRDHEAYGFYWENVFHQNFDEKKSDSLNVEFMESVSRLGKQISSYWLCRCLSEQHFVLLYGIQNT